MADEPASASDIAQQPSTVIGPSGDADILTKISDLERENYVLQEQLADAQASASAATTEAERFRVANAALEKAAIDRTDGFLKVDRERETLLIDKAALQAENARLKHSGQLLEAQTTRLLTEKRNLLEDVNSLKTDIQKAQATIAKLNSEADEFNAQKATLAHDKERWEQDKNLYSKSREWYLNECAERDKTISKLQLQISQFERDFGNERAKFETQIDELTLQAEATAANLADSETEIATLRERLDAALAENTRILDSTANELRIKERLTDAYKTEISSLKDELENAKNDVAAINAAIAEKQAALEAMGGEMRRITEEAASQMSDRETQIANLKDELEKANELLKFGSAGLNNIDFAEISPAAAAAAELLQNGTSLTSIYAKHCKVTAELAQEREERHQLEKYVQELLTDFKTNAPSILQMRREAESVMQENSLLREQLREVLAEREELMARCGSLEREFEFTRTELVYAQRENDTLKTQVKSVLAAMEKRNSPESSDEEIFASVQHVHKYNLELLNKIAQLESSRDEALTTGMRHEVEELEVKLSDALRELESLRNTHSQMTLIIEQVEKQRDAYKQELEAAVNRSPVKSKSNVNASQSGAVNDENLDVSIYTTRIAGLEDKIAFIVNDKQNTEKTLQERIDAQLELISQLRSTNGRLLSDLEHQKRNSELAVKRVREAEKEANAKAAQAVKARAELDTARAKNAEITDQMMRKVDEHTRLKVEHQQLTEKYEICRNSEIRLSAEVEVLRSASHKNERLNIALEALQGTISANTADKASQLQSQIDLLTVERDNYRNCLEDLRTSADRRCSEAQAACAEATAEKERIAVDLRYQREIYELLQKRFAAAEAELAKATQTTKSVNTSSEDIHQLRNSNAFLEKQNAEQKMSIAGLKARLEAKERELAEVSTVSGNFESTMRNQDEITRTQAQRLEGTVSELTAELEVAKSTIAELEEKLKTADEREANASQEMDNVRNAAQAEITELQRILSDAEQQREAAQQEISDRLMELATVRAERETVDSQLQFMEVQLKDAATLEAELRHKLKTASDEADAKVAETETTLNRLRNAEVLLLKENAHLSEEVKQLQARDKDLQVQCDTLLERLHAMTNEANTSTNLLDTSYADTSISHAASTDMLIDVLRKTKNREVELRMSAELELSRIRAQSNIDEARIASLSEEVAALQAQVQVNSQLTAEKSSLLQRLESLQSVQRQNVQLKNELTAATTNADAGNKQAKDLERQVSNLTTSKSQLNTRLATLTQDLAHARTELNETRARLSQAEKQLSMPQASSAASADKDALVAQITELKEALDKEKKKFLECRNLAKRYRDENSQLKPQLEKLRQDYEALRTSSETLTRELEAARVSQAPVGRGMPARVHNENVQLKKKVAESMKQLDEYNTSIATLKSTNEDLTKQVAELQAEIDSLQAKSNEADEIAQRQTILAATLQKAQTKSQELEKTVKLLESDCEAKRQLIIELEKNQSKVQAPPAAAAPAPPIPALNAARKRPISNSSVELPKRPKITFNEPPKEPTPPVQQQQPSAPASVPVQPAPVAVAPVVEQPAEEPIDVEVLDEEEAVAPAADEGNFEADEGELALLEGDDGPGDNQQGDAESEENQQKLLDEEPEGAAEAMDVQEEQEAPAAPAPAVVAPSLPVIELQNNEDTTESDAEGTDEYEDEDEEGGFEVVNDNNDDEEEDDDDDDDDDIQVLN
uniref:TPR_MLP1_2 domain-containing protein n=1 Tax=Panagrellus redivivus TaxID=6233 RepID=A0A7E4VRR1_PANRE